MLKIFSNKQELIKYLETYIKKIDSMYREMITSAIKDLKRNNTCIKKLHFSNFVNMPQKKASIYIKAIGEKYILHMRNSVKNSNVYLK